MNMKKLAIVGLLLIVLAVGAAPRENGGLFASLQQGQKVTLKETPQGFEIGVLPGLKIGYSIKQIAQDFLVLDDPAGLIETRIPIYSIRSIKITRFPKD